MTTELLDHTVLRRARRKLTRFGWVDIVEEKAERPDIVHDSDPTWPPTSPSPRYGTGYRQVSFSDEPLNRHMLICADPYDTVAWWDDGWPRATNPDRNPAVWLQMELGTRYVVEVDGRREVRHDNRAPAELLRENRRWPAPIEEAA